MSPNRRPQFQSKLIEWVGIVTISICLLSILIPVILARRPSTQSNVETPLGSVVAKSNTDGDYHYLPLTATNIIEYGNDWWGFTLNGNKWLFHTGYDQESLVLIPKMEGENE